MAFKPFTIGKYRFTQLLGAGGMAEVYRVQVQGASGFYKEFAIKRILTAHWRDEEFVRMFEREAKLTSLLTHANIVQVYDFFRSDDAYLLVMEFVHGKDLAAVRERAVANRRRVPMELAVHTINEILKGLDYAFNKEDPSTGKPLNVYHRDISPHNVMISYDGAVKLVDFGIAKAKDHPNLTTIGTVRGKIGYMSPEQALGGPTDHRSDIFAAALVLLELLADKKIFAANNQIALLTQAQRCEIPRPTALNPEIAPELERILLKALAKDVNQRYQDFGDFQRDLNSFLHSTWPDFSQNDVADYMHDSFSEEIAKTSKPDIPFAEASPISPGERDEILSGLTRFQEGEDPPSVPEESDPEPPPRPPPPRRQRSDADSRLTGIEGGTRQDPRPHPSHFPMVAALIVMLLSLGLAAYYRLVPRPERNEVAEKEVEPPPSVAPAAVPQVPPPPVEAAETRKTEPATDKPRAPAQVEKPREEDDKTDVADGEYDEALAETSRSKESKGSLAKRFYDQGISSFREARYRDALENFRKSRTLQKEFLPAWFYELNALKNLDRIDEARTIAQRLVAMRPDLKNVPQLSEYLGK